MPIDRDELPKKWLPLVRRLAGVADRECGNHGFAVITVEVLVKPNGEPAFWREPRVSKLEPRQGASEFLDTILDMFGESTAIKE